MRSITRRAFLKGAAAAVAAPYVVTPSALGGGDRPAPSRRIAMGFIGVGSQGGGVMRAFLGFPEVQGLAVCDVDAGRRERAKATVDARNGDRGCAAYLDFRDLLARPDIDAVSIATPDHGHVMPVLHAARAGKHIYCEKPLSLTVAEGRAMSDAVRRWGVVFQHGTQQRSDGRFRHAAMLARNGRLGKIHTVTVAVPGGRHSDTPASAPVPPTFDYDLWLGPSPWAPYSPQRVTNGYWFHTSDYSAGFVSGWGVHHVDVAQWGLGTELTGPAEVEGRGEYPREGLCDTAVTWHVECTYANGVRMVFTDNGANAQGVRFEGSDGWVYVRRGFIDAHPKALLQETFGPDEVRLYESRHHQGNLLECISAGGEIHRGGRGRGETAAPVEVAHRSTAICLIGDVAMRLGRRLRWDPQAERFLGGTPAESAAGEIRRGEPGRAPAEPGRGRAEPGDDEANRMLARAMRPPWRL